MAQHYERTAVRKRQIAEAALEVIAEAGLAGFTTRAVASRLAISDGTMFRHFANKEEIVLAAMARIEEELFGDELAALDDPLARLEALFRARARLLGGPKAIGRLVFSDSLLHAGGEAGHRKWSSWRTRTFAMIGGDLESLRAQGRLCTDLPIQALVRLVLGSLLTFSNQRAVSRGPIPDLEAHVDEAWMTLTTLIVTPDTST